VQTSKPEFNAEMKQNKVHIYLAPHAVSGGIYKDKYNNYLCIKPKKCIFLSESGFSGRGAAEA
jgi:hypothetical protein